MDSPSQIGDVIRIHAGTHQGNRAIIIRPNRHRHWISLQPSGRLGHALAAHCSLISRRAVVDQVELRPTEGRPPLIAIPAIPQRVLRIPDPQHVVAYAEGDDEEEVEEEEESGDTGSRVSGGDSSNVSVVSNTFGLQRTSNLLLDLLCQSIISGNERDGEGVSDSVSITVWQTRLENRIREYERQGGNRDE
jgi:hypothetical protein